MLMKIAYLRGPSDARIPVQIGTHQGKTLIECRDAPGFLKIAFPTVTLAQATPAQVAPEAPMASTLRGVFTPGHGAQFHIMDPLGTVSAGEIILPEPEAAYVLANIVW